MEPPAGIGGSSAREIAASLRLAIDRGDLRAGDALPPARALADRLRVNRNTVQAAFRILSDSGLLIGNRRAGTVVAVPGADVPPAEGYVRAPFLLDVGHGNPDPDRLPDLAPALRRISSVPAMYGTPGLDGELATWATATFDADQRRPFRVSVTGGAVDAVTRVLAGYLQSGDPVALEDPCYLASIGTVRRAGYRPLSVGVDEHGMIPDDLERALQAGARAVVCTPRAHNPTGASLTPDRARALRDVLARFPDVLVVEDDHFSLLSTARYATIIERGRRRWALVRSVSKFLGPDLRVALVASDAGTAERLSVSNGHGSMWVSHLLQRLTAAQLRDDVVMTGFADTAAHYRDRNTRFIDLLQQAEIRAVAPDGLNVWIDLGADEDRVLQALRHAGWLLRAGGDFALHPTVPRVRGFLRATVHQLDDDDMHRLVADLTEARTTASPTTSDREEHR